MRALAALLLVNLLFVAANAVAAGVILALGTIAKESTLLANSRFAWVVIILVGVAAGIAFLAAALRFIQRRRRARGPAPAQG